MDNRADPDESDAHYYARRAAWEREAGCAARTDRSRSMHRLLAQTYAELSRMLEGQGRLSEVDRLLVGLAIAGGLATSADDPDDRAAHARIARDYRRRMAQPPLPQGPSARHAVVRRAP